MPSDAIVIYSEDKSGAFVHTIVLEKDFPIKINFRGQVYDLIKTGQNKLRLGKESEERKTS